MRALCISRGKIGTGSYFASETRLELTRGAVSDGGGPSQSSSSPSCVSVSVLVGTL